MQRTQILLATAQSARELGCKGVTVAEVTTRAGVSRRAFYEMFDGREDCLLAALEDGVQRAAARVVPAHKGQPSWRSAVRAGLAELLAFIDGEPDLGALMIVYAPCAGRPALRRWAQIVSALVDAIDAGRAVSDQGAGLSRVIAEGAVGAVMSIVHTRLVSRDPAPLSDQLGALMSLIVAPYLGPEAAAQEIKRSSTARVVEQRVVEHRVADRRVAHVKVRLTHRTAAVLRAVAARPDASNREIATLAGIADQGQISKMLARLKDAGLLENVAQARHGNQRNAWRLSPEGVEIERAIRSHRG